MATKEGLKVASKIKVDYGKLTAAALNAHKPCPPVPAKEESKKDQKK
jgi:hypothetical protein